MESPAFDIAIIGSGPVGIALAWKLRLSRLRIVLLEAGGNNHTPAVEAEVLRASRKSPDTHPEAHLYRRRILGGASTVWGGRCLPFDAIDFTPNKHRLGWPIKKNEADLYVGPALDFLAAGLNFFDESAFAEPIQWGRTSTVIDFDSIERFSPPINVWTHYSKQLIDAGIAVMKNSLVTDVLLDQTGQRAAGLLVRDTLSGTFRQIQVHRVVLACGGIETARLLLSSRSVRRQGLGNTKDLVGRHYMTHLIGDIGTLTYSRAVPHAKLDYRKTVDGIYARSIMKLPEQLRHELDLPSVLWRPNIPPVWDPSHRNAILSSMHLTKRLIKREYAARLASQGGGPLRDGPQEVSEHGFNIVRGGGTLVAFAGFWLRRRVFAKRKLPSVFLRDSKHRYPMELNAEQYPDPNSRIGLSADVDRYGMPTVTLDWRPGIGTVEGILSSLLYLKERTSAAGIGHFDFDPENFSESLSPQGGHHMGTARMGATPDIGVVDRDCTLFDCRNVHVAGTAVFPTSGAVNPTLLAVALALRLADHILKLESSV